MIFTSLDLDWMTNLLVQAAQFTNWFHINFEGESREEIDFRDNKYEVWTETCTYAGYIITEY